jgi:hypothetical protein
LSLSSGTCFPVNLRFVGVFWEDPDNSLAAEVETFGWKRMQLRSFKRQIYDIETNQHDES